MKTKALPSTVVAVGLLTAVLGQATAQGLTLVNTYLSDPGEAPNAGLFIHGSLAFVGGLSNGYYSDENVGVRIVDMSNPANPQLLSRIPLRKRHLGGRYSQGGAAVTDISSEHFVGTIAVVTNGGPRHL